MSMRALTWAFGLPITLSQKGVLLVIADEASERGVCMVSVKRMAWRSSQSVATVQRRLKEMEQDGLLTRFARYQQNGRRTTDEIRLNLDKRPEDLQPAEQLSELIGDPGIDPDYDPDLHDAQAIKPSPNNDCGRSQSATTPASDCDGDGLTGEGGMVALVRPANVPLPYPDSPQSPPLVETSGAASEASSEASSQASSEADGLVDLIARHPGGPFSDRAKVARVFAVLSDAERIAARAAARDYADDVKRLKRKPKNIDRWLQERGWEAYPNATLPPAAPPRRFISDTHTLAALNVQHRLHWPAMTADLALTRQGGEGGELGLWWSRDIPPDVLALAQFAEIAVRDWTVVREGTAEFHAWRERIHAWVGRWPETERVFTEPHDPAVHALPTLHPNFRFRKSVPGLRVPCTWPPLKDGTLSTAPPSIVEDVDAVLAAELLGEDVL